MNCFWFEYNTIEIYVLVRMSVLFGNLLWLSSPSPPLPTTLVTIRSSWALALKIWHVSHFAAIIQSLCTFVCSSLAIFALKYSSELMQPSTSARASSVQKINITVTSEWARWPLKSPDAFEQDCVGYISGTKRKLIDAISSPRPWGRWLLLQPSGGFPQIEISSWNLPHW